MDFSDLVAPIPPDRFLAEHYRRGPLHIPAPQGFQGRRLLDWEGLNALLRIQRHWSRDNIRVMRNAVPVAPELYMEEVVAQEGPIERASAAKVEAILAMGASLVGQSVQQISPRLREVSTMLADTLRGRVTVNVFCSSAGVGAFNTHFDFNEAFAVHCEGEKTWRIYDRPADRPVFGTRYHEADSPPPAETRPRMTVTLKPGDVLYIPRGYRHDALATDAPSLHLSLAVVPPSGATLLKLLKELALHDGAFRDDLPDARIEDGGALRGHLDRLATRLAEIVRSPGLFDEIAIAQMQLAPRPYRNRLPELPALRLFVRTKKPARVVRADTGAAILVEGADRAPVPLGTHRPEGEWILARPLFSVEELAASFPYRTEEELTALLRRLEAVEIIREAAPKA